jgi:hypothetical protein
LSQRRVRFARYIASMVCYRRWIQACAAATLFFGGTCAGAVAQDAPGDSAPSPDAIFFRTFQRLESYPVPAYVVEISTWHVHTESQEFQFRWRYATRTVDGMTNSTRYPVRGKSLPVNAFVVPQSVGPLAWAVRPAAAALRDQLPAAFPDVPNLKNIASVVAYRPDYKIELAGVDSIDGHPSYHLRLHPYGDATKHNLRELWVDEQTFDLRRAHFFGKCGPCNGLNDIEASFVPAAGTWIMSEEKFVSGCGSGRTDICRFDLLTDDVAFVSGMPDWLFDIGAYREHAQRGEQDYLAGLLTEGH